MTTRVRNQCFTLFNYTEDDILSFKTFAEEKCKYLVIGFEVCPDTQKQHLQCAVVFNNPTSLSSLQKVTPGHQHHAGIIKALYGPNNAFDYCKKGEQPHDEWTKYGIKGPNFGDKAKVEEWGTQPSNEKSGSRTDLEDARTVIQAHDSWHDVLNDPNLTRVVSEKLHWCAAVFGAKPLQPMTWSEITNGKSDEPNLFQASIIAKLDAPPDDRSINWVYDPQGGSGKSILTKYLLHNRGAFYASGKMQDIFCLYQNERIILLDLPRSTDGDFINYGAIEKLKDGIIFSGKYQPTLKSRPHQAHVFIFSNALPDMTKWTKDRYCIIRVSEED